MYDIVRDTGEGTGTRTIQYTTLVHVRAVQ